MRRLAPCLLVLLTTVSGCGKSRLREDRPVVFVRGGVVLPQEDAAGLALHIQDAHGPQQQVPSVRVGEALFFRFSWEPGRRYTFEWRGERNGPARSATLTAPIRPEPLVVAKVRLEDVHAGSVTAGGEPDASLSFSGDGTRLAVGTFGGYLRAFDTQSGKCVFETRLPGAVVKRVAIDTEGSRIYAGEMSYDGFVAAFDLKSGKPLWRFRLADDLETSRPARADDFFALYSYPQVYCMRAVGGDLIVAGFHSWRDGGKPRHLSRMYRFDGRTGGVKWAWPEDGPLPRNISWFDCNDRVVALSAYQWEVPASTDHVPQAAVYLLDLASGRQLDRHAFEPLKPHFDTVPMWYGLALDDSGHLAVGLMDGRGVIFDVGARTLRPAAKVDLATPVAVTGVPIYAGAGWAAGSGKELYILTDGRLIAPSAGARGKTVRADHPASNTLFAFDGPTGKRLWQWKLTTTAQSVAVGKNVLAAATQQAYSSDDPMDYGLTVFDVRASGAPTEKMLFRYPTAGPVVALSVSPDGKTIATVEAPVRLADDLTVVGEYRLHILR